MYSKDLIETLLDEADIVTVISAFIPVIKKGRSYVAVCPFHDDKNPSLNISPEKKIFKCFVCGTGGNAISFVQKHLNISYQEAVKKVAEIIGFHDDRLENEAEKPKINKEKEPLFETINDLQSLYQYCLNVPEGKLAQEYLEKRHIDRDEIKKYGIGYALSNGEKTIEYLQKKGHSLDKIKGIGIVSSSSNSDANAGRLIFPLKDQNGQVIGFSARRLDNNKESPKYVNSPDTKIFKKSFNLYNYNNAKNSARRDGYIYVLEGFMDVMALDKAGIPSAVALMGTSLSKEQIELLRRLNAEIRLCLDGDNPGQRGMMKIILQLNKSGIPFRLVCNPNDLRDPDDILQESGPEALKSAMNQLVDAFQFQMNYYQNVEKLTKSEDREKVLLYSIPFLSSMKDGLEKENSIIRLSKVTGFEPEIIRSQLTNSASAEASLENISFSKGDSKIPMTAITQKVPKRLQNAEKVALSIMLKDIKAITYFDNNIQYFYTKIYGMIANYVTEYFEDKTESIPPALLLDEIETDDDASEKEKETMNKIVTELTYGNQNIYGNESIEDCGKIIREEKTKIFEENKLREEAKEPNADIAEILKKAIEKKKAQIGRNKQKKDGNA